jgi:hypothetical protein
MTGGTFLAVSAFDASASCGAAFCLVNTDWSVQGLWTEPGTRLDLRYESIDLAQPRAGRDRVSVGALPRDHAEVETRNRNAVVSLEGLLAPGWGYSVSLPFVDRRHRHFDDPSGENVEQTWNFSRPGDARVTVRHERVAARDDPLASAAGGFLVGLKLPTGAYDVRNADGELAERTLQPGTGTTDLLAGAYWRGAFTPETSWFAQVQGVLPLGARAGYRPGRSALVDGGVRYSASSTVGLLMQVNVLVRGRDSGGQSEPQDSGQRQAWLSPGVAWNFARDGQVYAFVQVPVYQYVNGLQLTANRSFSAGLSWRF